MSVGTPDGLIGVVVPTLGERTSYLRLCLDSIGDQEGVCVRTYVVAPSVLSEDIMADPRTTFVHDPGGGLSAALNAGLAVAAQDCRYFTWLGDDDLLRPGALREARSVLESDASVTLVYGRCDYIDERGRTLFVNTSGHLARRIIGWGPNLLPQPGSLMRLESVVKVGGLDEELRLAMDLDLFLRLRRVGRVIYLPRTLGAFRWHAGSMTVGSERASFAESDLVRRRYAPSWLRPMWPLLSNSSRLALAAAKMVIRRRARQL